MQATYYIMHFIMPDKRKKERENKLALNKNAFALQSAL